MVKCILKYQTSADGATPVPLYSEFTHAEKYPALLLMEQQSIWVPTDLLRVLRYWGIELSYVPTPWYCMYNEVFSWVFRIGSVIQKQNDREIQSKEVILQ